jgi:DNA-binding NarL/FixJ family response regulator
MTGWHRRDRTLSPRQLETAKLVSEGLTNKEIAARFGCSLGNVKHLVEAISYKLDTYNRAQIAIWYVQEGVNHEEITSVGGCIVAADSR